MDPTPPAPGPRAPEAEMVSLLRSNIDMLASLRRATEAARDCSTRVADAITRFTGSMRSVAFHSVLFGGWILVNLGLVPGVRPFDPFPFVMLAMIASVEAIFLSTFVLISQNRSAALATQRDELDVQDKPPRRARDYAGDPDARHADGAPAGGPAPAPHLEAIKQDVSAEKVVREIERNEGRGDKP